MANRDQVLMLIKLQVYGRRPTQKGGGPWTKYKQIANLGNSYCSYNKKA